MDDYKEIEYTTNVSEATAQQTAELSSYGIPQSQTIQIGAGSTAFKVDDSGLWLGAIKYADAPFKVDMNGNLTASSAVISGSGTITLASGGYIKSGQTAYDTGTGFWIGNDGGTPKLSIGNSAGRKMTWNGTALTVDGVITATSGSSLPTDYLSGVVSQTNLNLANRGWTQTCAFSVTDADTVAWASGNFVSADGTSYSITGSNTGNMAARTYIYFDINVSTTAYQTTTTAATAVGAGKVLIATAINGTAEAEFEVFGGVGGSNINASQIVASSITANEIAASTITAGKLSVSSLSSISADIGTITAGSLTGITITASQFRTDTSGNRVVIDKDLVGSIDAIKLIGSDASEFYIYNNNSGNLELEGGDVLVEGNLRVYTDIWSETADLRLKDNSGHTIAWFDGSDDSINVTKFFLDGWELTMTAAKTAIVETSDGYRALYCTESPEVWFMDFCDTKETVDPMFMEVTEGNMKFIKCDDGSYQVWRRRKGMSSMRFDKKTVEEYDRNNRFWSMPLVENAIAVNRKKIIAEADIDIDKANELKIKEYAKKQKIRQKEYSSREANKIFS